MKKYYQVIKKSVSSWHADGSPIIERDCGHKHRTAAAATKCKKNLLYKNHPDGTWSAAWHNCGVYAITDRGVDWQSIVY